MTTPVTVSAGTATAGAGSIDEIETLIPRADRALYEAKAAGKNRVGAAAVPLVTRPGLQPAT